MIDNILKNMQIKEAKSNDSEDSGWYYYNRYSW